MMMVIQQATVILKLTLMIFIQISHTELMMHMNYAIKYTDEIKQRVNKKHGNLHAQENSYTIVFFLLASYLRTSTFM